MRRFVASLACLFGFLALIVAAPSAFAETSLTATVDRTAVAPGERFTLTLAFTGTQSAAAPDLGKLQDFKAHYIGPITRMQTSGGRVEMSVSHRYVLTAPQTAGRYTIQPMRIVVDGQPLQTQPIAIAVGKSVGKSAGKPGTAAPAPELELRVIPEVDAPWVGQRVPVIVRLRVGDTRVDDLNYPQLTAAGATLEDFAKPSRRDEWDGGRRVQILEFRTTLTPLKPGTLTLDDVFMDMAVLEAPAGGRRNGLFDDFFSASRRRSIRLRADPVSLNVSSLPQEGRPAGFSGAVGTFEFQVSAGPTELAVGDPITLQMKIVGVGNLESVKPPAIEESGKYKTYEPTVITGDKRGGTLTFEQVLIPKTRSVRNLPALSFIFFDPFDREYRIARSAPIPIRVDAAAPQVSGVISMDSATRPAELPPQLGKDIVYIKERPGSFRDFDATPHPVFLGSQAVPVALFLAAAVYARRRSALFADPHALRARQAGGVARKRLRGLGAIDADSSDALTEIVAGYLGDRLDLPPGRIDKDHVLARLSELNASTAAVTAVENWFTKVENLRYGGSGTQEGSGESARALAAEIVKKLEGDRSLAKVTTAAVMAIVGFGCSLALADVETPPSVMTESPAVARTLRVDPMEAFFAGNGAYSEGDYAAAGNAYESALSSGVQSAALWFNAGNARFKQGHMGAAIAAYERSLQFAPRDPDTAANLAFARESLAIEVAKPPTIERFLTPLASRMSVGELADAAAAFWWIAWLLAAAATLNSRIRTPMRRLALASALLFFFFAANYGVRYRDTVWKQWVVVVAPGESTVRYEPSEGGTEHFATGEGAKLELRRRRDGWIQVRRSDGRRGWIAADAIERL